MLSVIICSHNPRKDYLQRTLQGLRAQSLSTDQWELLLVDNASEQKLSESWDIAWHCRGRHIREDKLGLTVARLCGIRESRGEFLVFADDDNVLAPDYLQTAQRIATEYPYLGVFGSGALDPEFEIQPPTELLPLTRYLALRRVGTCLWTNNLGDWDSLPWGAGLCVRRPLAELYVELINNLNINEVLGRQGQQLFCGEDDLFSRASIWAGQGFGIFPELQITHLISAHRLSRGYFLRLLHDHAFSHAILRFLLGGPMPRQIKTLRYPGLLINGLREGLFSMRCRWAAAKGEMDALEFVQRSNLRAVEQISARIVAKQLIRPSNLSKHSVS